MLLRLAGLVAAIAACNSASAKNNPKGLPDAPDDKDSQLITKQLVAMNANDQWGRPAQGFNAGTVTPRAMPSAKKTKHGYEIRFSNSSPVSTPTVYDGRIYSSGGFNSREFYAFDAKTGKGEFALDLSDDGPSAGACSDGTCVFNTESCTTFAIDASTGKQRWSWFLGDPQTSSPSIANGRVFTSYPAAGTDGKKERPPNATHVLAAFDLKTGKVLWQDWLDADVISAPVAVGDFVYVATFNGTVIKLEQATGKIRYATKARATSAPVVEFVAGLESMYYTRRADAIDVRSTHAGAIQPAKPATPAPAPSAKEEIVRTDHNDPQERYHTETKDADYLDDKTQDASALKQTAANNDKGNGFAGGAPASAQPAMAKALVGQSNVATIQQFQGSRILHLGKLNVNTMGDELIATDPENGAKHWSHKLEGDMRKDGGALAAPPIAAGNHLVVATLHGKVLEIDPRTGKTEATFDVGGPLRSQPVAVDGWIYIGTEDGRLVAIDTGDKTLTGWPMWGGNAARTGSVE